MITRNYDGVLPAVIMPPAACSDTGEVAPDGELIQDGGKGDLVGTDNKTQIDRHRGAWAGALARSTTRQEYPGHQVAPQLTWTDATGAAAYVQELLKQRNVDTDRVYIHRSHPTGDLYKVTAVNYQGKESN